jgi:hypothetical protein
MNIDSHRYIGCRPNVTDSKWKPSDCIQKTWWPGMELNPRRQPFQGCSHPKLSVDSARHSDDSLPVFVLLIGAKQGSTNLPAEICLKSTRPHPAGSLRLFISSRMSPFEPATGGTPAQWPGSRNSRLRRLLRCLPPHAAVRLRLRE